MVQNLTVSTAFDVSTVVKPGCGPRKPETFWLQVQLPPQAALPP